MYVSSFVIAKDGYTRKTSFEHKVYTKMLHDMAMTREPRRA